MRKSALRLLPVMFFAFTASNAVSAPPPDGKGKNTAPEIVAPRWVDANGAFIGLYAPSERPYYNNEWMALCGEDCNDYDRQSNLLIQLPDENNARVLIIKPDGLWNTQTMYFTDPYCRIDFGDVYVGGLVPEWVNGYGLAADGANAYRADLSVPPADVRYTSHRRPGGDCYSNGANNYSTAYGVYPIDKEKVFSVEGLIPPFRVSIVK